MKKYEKIENIYKRKSTRRNSKWSLDYTNAKRITDEELLDTIENFYNCPLEKYIEDYEGIKAKGRKYTVMMNDLTKKEIIILSLD